MTTVKNHNFMRRFLEASIGKNSAAFKELLAPEFVAHVPGGPKNREEFVEHMSFYNRVFSNMQVKVLDLVADEEKVVARTSWRGTHNGEFMGIPPTGREMEIEAFIVERLKDGKSVEHWSLFDQFTMMQQLGLLPPPQANS